MKKFFLFAVLSAVLLSCGNRQPSSNASDEATSVKSETVFELDALLPVADQELDKTVTVIGYVTHVCKHSGKRCFIVGESHEASMRIEAKGEIGGFNRELVGSKLAVTGVLQERRLSKEYIAEMEKDASLRMEGDDGDADTCAAELKNIEDMRQWMKDHNKEYYVIYFMDGLSFDELES